MEKVTISAALKEDLAIRVARLQQLLSAAEAEGMLISSNTALYYTTGQVFRGYVYIPADGDAKWLVIRPTDISADNVLFIRKPEQIFEVLEKANIAKPKRLAVEFDTLPYSQYTRIAKCFPEVEFVNASHMLVEARITKTPYEIKKMEEDGRKQAGSYRRISGLYRENMTDIEFQIEIERVLRLEGCLGFLRTAGSLMEINMGNVIAGDNADSTYPYDFAVGGGGIDLSLPVGANGTVLRRGVAIMVDMNGNFNGYQTDMTRIWSVGELEPLAQKAHQAALDILHTLEAKCVPGFPISEMWNTAEQIVKDYGLEDYFMGHKQKAGFLGHGIGIELNEAPVIMKRNSAPLRKNMTIALEPKFVIPHVGVVGAENTYVVTESGLRNLTVFPEEIQNLID